MCGLFLLALPRPLEVRVVPFYWCCPAPLKNVWSLSFGSARPQLPKYVKPTEELEDQCKVVFAEVPLGTAAWEIGWEEERGPAATPPPPQHPVAHLRRWYPNKLCKDDFVMVSVFLHGKSLSTGAAPLT
jgi:hypothetical protein